MMLVEIKPVFKGVIENPIMAVYSRNGSLGVTHYPSNITFDMLGLWYLNVSTQFDEIAARNMEMVMGYKEPLTK